MTDQWLATLQGNKDGVDVVLIDTSEYRERLRLVLEGATRASMCFGLEKLCVADDQGHIATVDLETGQTRILDFGF
jgi:hypothetical protein